jgi:hypothetical protein
VGVAGAEAAAEALGTAPPPAGGAA